MHEMAVTQSMLEVVLQEAAKAGANKVVTVNLVIGEMTGIVDRCVEANFELLSQNTLAEGAALSFQNIPREARCRHCGHLFRPADFLWQCPECQFTELEFTAGDELYIESIEVE
jgi:hydrogenase nickel incorporation protein HypA/HybF